MVGCDGGCGGRPAIGFGFAGCPGFRARAALRWRSPSGKEARPQTMDSKRRRIRATCSTGAGRPDRAGRADRQRRELRNQRPPGQVPVLKNPAFRIDDPGPYSALGRPRNRSNRQSIETLGRQGKSVGLLRSAIRPRTTISPALGPGRIRGNLMMNGAGEFSTTVDRED